MSVDGIRYMNAEPDLPVRDVDASVAFYRQVLGLEPKIVLADGSLAILWRDSAELVIYRHDRPPVHSARIDVTGADRLQRRAVDAGARIEEPSRGRDAANFVVIDPDGHRLGIGESPD
jgi:catechol 2,3-dioxygenase-like lactoylglutathione lyase family enzyme